MPAPREDLPHPFVLPGTGELPLALYGRMEKQCAGSVAGAGRIGENPALEDDLPTVVLGADGQRLHAGYQQPRRAEDPLHGQ